MKLPSRSEGGYFADDSLIREVHLHRAVGIHYGIRGLVRGALNPIAYVGTARHTHKPERPFSRLSDTGIYLEDVFVGSKSEADRALRIVASMHRGVKGVTSEKLGQFPAGTEYSAYDPDLMLWTIGVIADSAVYFYELLVRRLSTEEKNKLWGQYLEAAELFGMDISKAPKTWAELQTWLDKKMDPRMAHLTDGARDMGTAIALDMPLPRYARAVGYRIYRNALIRGSLSPRERELYKIDWKLRHKVGFVATVVVGRAFDLLAPRSVAIGRNKRLFEAIKVVETRRIGRGIPSPVMVP
jgi:uncharacterized protein (DUF2236 family)